MSNGCCIDRSCIPATCMTLPDGQTCSDCVHCGRCTAMFGAKPTNTWCDFFPRRFVQTAMSAQREMKEK